MSICSSYFDARIDYYDPASMSKIQGYDWVKQNLIEKRAWEANEISEVSLNLIVFSIRLLFQQVLFYETFASCC